MTPWYLHPAFRPARLQDLVLWVNPSSVHGTTWQNLAPRYSNVNHGRIIGAQVGELLHPSGVFGSALYFNGQNAYVDCGQGESLNITDAITIEAWVKPNVPASVQSGDIVDKGDYSTESGYRFCFDHGEGMDNQFFLNWNPGTAKALWSPDEAVKVGEWNHLVGVYVHNVGNRLYVDGELVASNSVSGDITPNSLRLKIGDGFNGTIDEVRIYEAALSPAEVTHNYTHSPIYYMQHGIDPLELLAMSPKEISRVVA
ncbi:MAG: hypothetical protein DRP85_05465 [Candidatus Makaraimicrobium thalassicum]|nr:MAG: hypothetical protein DRP85_05465 [Candidatus Omnitrophota bacterium]